MNLINKELDKSLKYNDFIKNLKNKKSPIAISGLTGVAESTIITAVQEGLKSPILVITYNEVEAIKLKRDFEFFTDKVVYFPKKEIITYDYVAESKNLPYERIDVLNRIYKDQNIIIITSIEALKQKIISKSALYKNVLNFKVGDRVNLEDLKQKLVDLGYKRFELIDGRGEFSIRGGIIDVSITETQGIRIELWGDEIDSIRHFNIVSQRSIDALEKAQIFPAHEYILDIPIDKVCDSISKKVCNSKLQEKIEKDIEQIRNGEYISKIDRYFDSFYQEQDTLFEYLCDKYIFFIDEINKVKQRSNNIELDNQNVINALVEKERIVPDAIKNYINTEDFELKLEKRQTIYMDKLDNIFNSGIEKYNFITSAFGGFWRYTKVKDFCYLVNPYFPPKRLVEKMQNEFQILLTQYPSGENVQNMNAERLFGVDKEHILVGNGAAELINALGHIARGTIAVNLPAFNEYVRCFKNCVIHEIDNSKIDYKMDVKTIEKAIRECDYTAVINPDNPSGFMLDKEQILALASVAKEAGHKLIIDESFVDFADGKRRFTLLDDKFISENPNVIVIKSISKSYGVPGIRLGLLASSDKDLIKALRDDMQIWNINSFGEYYLQIYQLFAKDYEKACDAIVNERNRVIAELRKLKSIRVYDSEANYILVDLKENNSLDLAAKLLDEKHILIKDLSTKNYFHKKNFVRLAIRDENDNSALIAALNEYLK